MIESIQIKNFKSLRSVECPDCRRINVVVGKNASGKTALLEALFLVVATSPEMALRIRGWRGYDQPLTGSFAQIETAIWDGLFYRFDKTNDISINVTDTERQERSLLITAGQTSEVMIPTGGIVQPFMQASQFGISSIEWKWTREDGTVSTIRPNFIGAGYQFPGVEMRHVPASFFAAGYAYNSQENVNRFSEISKRREEGPLIAAISKAFPVVRGVDIQAHAGMSMVHADIPALPEKIPLGGVSAGVSKLTAILLAIAEQDKSIVMIDEIENGIHYSLYEPFWKTLYDFARDHDVQIFASTHSAECLEGLVTACRRHAGDLSIIRASLDEDGETVLSQFHGSAVVDGIRHGEIR